MRTIRHTKTLFYYDGPQVFEARDAIGGHYIGVMVEPEAGEDRYLIKGSSPESLRLFRSGALDLRSLLLDTVSDDWFLGTAPGGFGEPFATTLRQEALDNSGFLPESGFFLHDQVTADETLREARERNNLVMEVSVEPPEATYEHRIRVSTLAALLNHVQTVVKHAYGVALRDLSLETRRAVDKSNAHLLDVVIPAAPGSFRVFFEASKETDLLGRSEMARALERVDQLFEHAADPARALAIVKEHKGHLAGAYLRLLKFLVETRTGIRYSWAEPGFSRPKAGSVSESQARPLVDVLSGVSNLGAEQVSFVGKLEKGDTHGTWRISSPEGDFSGKVREGGPSMEGLKLGSTYRFSCLEEIEEVESTGREIRSLYLLEYEPV
jgi:hypothetical protein